MKSGFCKKSQVSLEIAISFIVILLFLIGMVRIWFWGNSDLLKRQDDYINTRSARHGHWPIHNTDELDDSKVF